MKYKMICTLKEGHVTEEGDLVPAGTPVDVLGWGKQDQSLGVKPVLCRAHAYMHIGDEPQDLSKWNGNVGVNLYIEVYQGDLIFSDVETFGE